MNIFLIKDESQLHGSSQSESRLAQKPFSSYRSSKQSSVRSKRSGNSIMNKFGHNSVFEEDVLEETDGRFRGSMKNSGSPHKMAKKDATITYLSQIIEPDVRPDDGNQSQADLASIGLKQDRRYLLRKNSHRFQLLIK